MDGEPQNRIRALRRARDLSQEALAELLGCSKQTVSALENETMQLTQAWMRRIAKALNCAPGDLLSPSEGGELHKLPVDIKAIVDLLSDLTPDEQASVREVAETVVAVIKERKRAKQRH